MCGPKSIKYKMAAVKYRTKLFYKGMVIVTGVQKIF